jgi:hypothetical protein
MNELTAAQQTAVRDLMDNYVRGFTYGQVSAGGCAGQVVSSMRTSVGAHATIKEFEGLPDQYKIAFLKKLVDKLPGATLLLMGDHWYQTEINSPGHHGFRTGWVMRNLETYQDELGIKVFRSAPPFINALYTYRQDALVVYWSMFKDPKMVAETPENPVEVIKPQMSIYSKDTDPAAVYIKKDRAARVAHWNDIINGVTRDARGRFVSTKHLRNRAVA